MSEGRVTKVLIWIPLRCGSKWRGEGIAQTIENIITNCSDRINYTLFVSPHMLSEVTDSLGNFDHIQIRTFSLFKEKKTVFNTYSPTELLEKSSFIIAALKFLRFERVKKRLKSFAKAYSVILYSMRLYILTSLQRSGRIFDGHDLIWIPTPSIPFAEKLKGKKIASFWDPFLFEYLECAYYVPALFKKLYLLYARSSCVITQSKSNCAYLQDILNLPPSKINMICVGSPNYRKTIDKHYPDVNAHKRNPERLIQLWEMKPLGAAKRSEAFDIFNREIVNKSIFNRLIMRMTPDTKILIVSTQLRFYKGAHVLMDLLDYCMRHYDECANLQVILTSPLPEEIKKKYPWAIDKIHEITRVSNKQHALLYAVSDLALHPSFVEGGLGSYPQFEAASIGIPCLNNLGRHTLEQERTYGPQMQLTYTDFCQPQIAAKRILDLLYNPAERAKNIEATLSASSTWEDVASRYVNTFKAIADD